MRKRLLLFLLFFPALCQAQKQGNIWHFGSGLGLDFNGSTPKMISGGMSGRYGNGGTFRQEGTSSICDKDGKLLFYTDGQSVWNKNHQLMPNGTGLTGDSSISQGALILPQPGSNSLYYIVTGDVGHRYTFAGPPLGYRYSVVDICLQNGLGDVVTSKKNILLADSASERLCAAADGRGNYWVIGHKGLGNKFLAWKLTSSGFGPTVTTATGSSFSGSSGVVHVMKINPQASILAATSAFGKGANIEVFNFDTVTGNVLNGGVIAVDSLLTHLLPGIEFSPNGQRLYVGLYGDDNRIYQYTFPGIAFSHATVSRGRTRIFQGTSSTASMFGGMQLGPDGAIYMITRIIDTRIGRLTGVNGSSVGFDSSVFTMSGVLNQLPVFVAGFRYHNQLPCTPWLNVAPDLRPAYASISPNPASGYINLNLDGNISGMAIDLRLLDLSGRSVKSVRTLNTQTISVQDLSPGIYICELRYEGRLLKAEKLVIR